MTVGVLIGLLVGALVVVVAQRNEIIYQRNRVEKVIDHERRIERVTSGLTENPVEPARPDPIPPGLEVRIREAIGSWEGGVTQAAAWDDVRNWRREGLEWAEIADRLERDG